MAHAVRRRERSRRERVWGVSTYGCTCECGGGRCRAASVGARLHAFEFRGIPRLHSGAFQRAPKRPRVTKILQVTALPTGPRAPQTDPCTPRGAPPPTPRVPKIPWGGVSFMRPKADTMFALGAIFRSISMYRACMDHTCTIHADTPKNRSKPYSMVHSMVHVLQKMNKQTARRSRARCTATVFYQISCEPN